MKAILAIALLALIQIAFANKRSPEFGPKIEAEFGDAHLDENGNQFLYIFPIKYKV